MDADGNENSDLYKKLNRKKKWKKTIKKFFLGLLVLVVLLAAFAGIVYLRYRHRWLPVSECPSDDDIFKCSVCGNNRRVDADNILGMWNLRDVEIFGEHNSESDMENSILSICFEPDGTGYLWDGDEKTPTEWWFVGKDQDKMRYLLVLDGLWVPVWYGTEPGDALFQNVVMDMNLYKLLIVFDTLEQSEWWYPQWRIFEDLQVVLDKQYAGSDYPPEDMNLTEGEKDKTWKYIEASTYFEAELYEEAAAIFAELEGYKDSDLQLQNCNRAMGYLRAMDHIRCAEYEQAIELLRGLGDYKDSAEKLKECQNDLKYLSAFKLFKEDRFEEAVVLFYELGDHEFSADYARDCENEISYNEACMLLAEGQYAEARELFEVVDAYEYSGGYYKYVDDKLELCEEIQQLAEHPLFVDLAEKTGINFLGEGIEYVYTEEEYLNIELCKGRKLEFIPVIEMRADWHIQLPMLLGELLDMGWHYDVKSDFWGEDLPDPFPNNSMGSYTFIDKQGKRIDVTIDNVADEPMALRDTIIIEVCLERNKSWGIQINGISCGDKMENVLTEFGMPCEIRYKVDEQEKRLEMRYSDADEMYSVIYTIDLRTRKVCAISCEVWEYAWKNKSQFT